MARGVSSGADFFIAGSPSRSEIDSIDSAYKEGKQLLKEDRDFRL
jgi:hypothetical protein